MVVVESDAIGVRHLGWLAALLAELGHERSIITREYLHSMVVGFGNEQETSMNVERQVARVVELATRCAWLLGADRKQDATIDAAAIKGIAHRHPKSSQTQEMICNATRQLRSDDTTRQQRSNKEQHLASPISPFGRV